jgi:hypothetical protein
VSILSPARLRFVTIAAEYRINEVNGCSKMPHETIPAIVRCTWCNFYVFPKIVK